MRDKNSEQDPNNTSWNQKNPVTFVFKSAITPHNIPPVQHVIFKLKISIYHTSQSIVW